LAVWTTYIQKFCPPGSCVTIEAISDIAIPSAY